MKDRIAARQRLLHERHKSRRRHRGLEPDKRRLDLRLFREADVDELGFRQHAVGNDREIMACGQKMHRLPVGLDDAALDAAIDDDPVADAIGSSKADRDAGKDIGQRALKREAGDDRDRTGGGEERADGNIEFVADDGDEDAKIDEAGDQLLEQAAFMRPALEDHERIDEADERAGERDPPKISSRRMPNWRARSASAARC